MQSLASPRNLQTSISSSHLKLPYSLGRVALGETQWGLMLALTTQETPGPAHPVVIYRPLLPCPCTADPSQRARLVGSGHSQSLQLSGLGESLPLTGQQQPRLNHKRRVCTAHMKATPLALSLGGGGVCATGPYRTPTTIGHTTKTGSQSSST